MKQRQGDVKLISLTTVSRLLLIGLVVTAAQIFGAEAERKPQGKPAATPDFVLTIKDNLVSVPAKDASLKKVLEEIGRRMSIEMLALLPEQEKITTEFEKGLLEEAIDLGRPQHQAPRFCTEEPIINDGIPREVAGRLNVYLGSESSTLS